MPLGKLLARTVELRRRWYQWLWPGFLDPGPFAYMPEYGLLLDPTHLLAYQLPLYAGMYRRLEWA